MDVLCLVINISVEITACIHVIGYVISLSVTSLAITYQPFSSGLLCTLLKVTVDVVVDINVTIVAGLLEPLKAELGNLGIIDVFVSIGIYISL